MNKALLKTGITQSVSTDGVNDYCKAPAGILPTSLSGCTLCGWVKRTRTVASYQVAIHSSVNANIGQSDYFLGFRTGTNELLCSLNAKVSGWSSGATGITSTLDQWYFMATTWNGSTVKKYVDNVAKGTYSMSSFTPYTTAPTRLGASNDGTTYRTDMVARDFRMYDRELNLDELEMIKNGMKISKAGLLAHWDCNKLNADGDIPDLSGNGNDMVLNNGATLVTDTP